MKKKLLLHCCCAPCTSGVVPQLDDYDLTLFFYNPNIDTLEEFNRRLATLEEYVSKYNEEFSANLSIITIPYNHDEFELTALALKDEPEGGKRCSFCMEMRLDYTGKYARENGFDLFCSTLSVSPHKNNELINYLGGVVSNKYGIEYLPNNFKKDNGFLMSVQNSHKYGLYRQRYCGCEFAKSHIKPHEDFIKKLQDS